MVFQKGYIPWNKGLIGWTINTSAGFQKGMIAWNKDLTGYKKGFPTWNSELKGGSQEL